MIKRYFTSLVCILMCSSLLGCSTVQMVNEYMPWYSGNEVQSIGLKVNTGAAMKYAVSVDIIFAYDENVMTLMTNISSEQWFNEKAGYLSSYGPQMDVIQRQIVPGYSEFIEVFPGRSVMAKGVYAFAYYPNNPNAKADITAIETPWLIFDEAQMNVVSEAPVGTVEQVLGSL